MSKRRFLFISPHLDDVVLSCGGYISKLRRYAFPVSVLTLFSGSPAGRLSILARKLHQDWRLPKDAPAVRREEDRQALGLLGAEALHANFLDCIYRRDERGFFLYKHISHVLDQDAAKEEKLVNEIASYLLQRIQDGDWNIVYAPLALGGHIDHHVVRAAVLNIRRALPEITFHFYEDLPYVISDLQKPQLEDKDTNSYLCFSESNNEKKFTAMKTYQSQIKCADYPTGIDIDAIMHYGIQAGKKGDRLGERIWYAKDY